MKLASAFFSMALMAALAVGQAGAAQTQTLHGTIVDYLSAIGANGGIVSTQNGTGGITVNTQNAGIHTHGSTQLVQPLGLKANGQVYLLDVSKNNGSVVSKLSGDKGKSVSVKGHAVTRDGASIFVVDSIS